MTRAMVVVLLVAGSLVVIACGAATFLRYRKDDDDDNDDDDDDNNQDRHRGQNGGDRTVVGTDAMCITALGDKTATTDEPPPPAGVCISDLQQPSNNAMPNTGTNKISMPNKEYLHGGGRGPMGGSRSGRGPSPASGGCDTGGLDVCGGMPIAVLPPSHASPTSVLRGASSSGVYGTKPLQHIKASDQSGRVSQSYHRNPDIIPAPLLSPAGTVYNGYGSQGKRHGCYISHFIAFRINR